jgi:hypothetical protein
MVVYTEDSGSVGRSIYNHDVNALADYNDTISNKGHPYYKPYDQKRILSFNRSDIYDLDDGAQHSIRNRCHSSG